MLTAGHVGGVVILRFLLHPRNLACFVLTVFAMAMAASVTTPIADPDVWWVAAAGRELLSTGAIPRQNLFSYVEPGHPWIMHEWLLGPVYAVGLGALGPGFFIAVALVTLSAGLALILSATVGRTRSLSVGLAGAFFCVAFFGSRLFSARPTGVALLFPLALTLVAFAPRFSSRSIAFSLAIELLWANSHGSFPLGVLLLAVAAAEQPTDRRARLLASAGCALVTVVNPYGLSLHRFVAGYLLGRDGIYRSINSNIREFQNIVGAYGATVGPIDLVGLAVAIFVAIWALRDRAVRLRSLFCLLLLVGAIRQARHIELAGLLTTFLLLPWLDRKFAGRLVEVPWAARVQARYLAYFVVPITVLGAGLLAWEYRTRAPAEFVDSGAELLQALESIPDGANTYVPFGRAGFAIWYGFPRKIRVFFDPRNDCYSAETFATFRELEDPALTDRRLSSIVGETKTTAAVLDAPHPLRSRVEHAGFRILRSNDTFFAYRMATP